MSEKEFINSCASKFVSKGIKNFPRDFIEPKDYTELKLPGKTLLIGEEFFGKYEMHTADGNSILHADNYSQAKYILYANRTTPGLLNLPVNDNELKTGLRKYESYLDSIIKVIETDYKKSFPDQKNSRFVVNEVFKLLNLVRV